MKKSTSLVTSIIMNCSFDAIIKQVHHDQLSIMPPLDASTSFHDLLHDSSKEDGISFWKSLSNHGLICSYPLNFKRGDNPIACMVTAIWSDENVWLAVLYGTHHTLHIAEELLKMNNEQQNIIRRNEKQLHSLYAMHHALIPPDEVLEEMSRINNELSNTRRELIIKNKELNNANNRLQESIQELDAFAYGVSHDLVEPLRMVKSFMSLLEKKYSHVLDDKGKQYIFFAADGAERMERMIKDLLAYSRSIRSEMKKSSVNLQSLMLDIIELYKLSISEKNAQIIFDTLPEVYASPVAMQQIMYNLIGNALKFHEQGASPIIRIEVEEKEDSWQISVSDNGIGISADQHEKIFEVFAKLHSAREYPGSGIGLALCRKLVEKHGGKIWVEPVQAIGTCIKFTLSKP